MKIEKFEGCVCRWHQVPGIVAHLIHEGLISGDDVSYAPIPLASLDLTDSALANLRSDIDVSSRAETYAKLMQKGGIFPALVVSQLPTSKRTYSVVGGVTRSIALSLVGDPVAYCLVLPELAEFDASQIRVILNQINGKEETDKFVARTAAEHYLRDPKGMSLKRLAEKFMVSHSTLVATVKRIELTRLCQEHAVPIKNVQDGSLDQIARITSQDRRLEVLRILSKVGRRAKVPDVTVLVGEIVDAIEQENTEAASAAVESFKERFGKAEPAPVRSSKQHNLSKATKALLNHFRRYATWQQIRLTPSEEKSLDENLAALVERIFAIRPRAFKGVESVTKSGKRS